MTRDVVNTLGRTRVSSCSDSDNGETHRGFTLLPGNLPFVFPNDNEFTARLMLGEEAMWQQGFPIDIIDDKMMKTHKQKTLMDLAGNMVSPPVLMDHLLASICEFSWQEPDSPWEQETGVFVGQRPY